MDFMGNTVVRTPLTANILENEGTNGIVEADWRFNAEMGAGQGDIRVPSPSNWNALFDILLTALRKSNLNDYSSMGPFGHTIPADNVAFADDLLVFCLLVHSAMIKRHVPVDS
jgi:hypothetical protein